MIEFIELDESAQHVAGQMLFDIARHRLSALIFHTENSDEEIKESPVFEKNLSGFFLSFSGEYYVSVGFIFDKTLLIQLLESSGYRRPTYTDDISYILRPGHPVFNSQFIDGEYISTEAVR